MQLLSTNDIIKKFKVSYQTLNYYTNMGFFNIIERRGNKRMYDETEVRTRLENIVNMKNEGYPLRLIVKKLNNKEA